jgi:hypothetical protein
MKLIAMKFDLTKEITLDPKSLKTYQKLRAFLYALSVTGVLSLIYIIIFPTAYFTFSFPNPNSNKNNIIEPRDKSGPLEKGKVPSNSPTLFDSALVGNYSKTKISLTLDKKSKQPIDGTISVRKSYQAFLYPEGNPIGFKDGTLLKNQSNYYIASDGKLRRFRNDSIANELGFDRSAFMEISSEDLKHNEAGEEISDSSAYPDNTLFKVGEEYYTFLNGKLKKFISPQAFASQYSENQVISKGDNFLDAYPLDENLIGFADGSLISYGISAYIVSDGKVLPINNVTTFENMGYDWSDLIAVSGDEFSLYEKTALFTIDSPHPSGTIFKTSENAKEYLIQNNLKHLLPSEKIVASWLRKKPIMVSENSLSISDSCVLKKETLSFRTYSCEISTDRFKGLIGKDYEFKLSTKNGIKIETLDIAIKKTMSTENIRSAISGFINKVKGNYVASQN